MKKLLIAGLSLLSITSYAQSYLILGNGITVTVDKDGFAYDIGSFTLPNTVTLKGGSFFFDGMKVRTIDAKGFIYPKDLRFKKVKGKGLNYVAADDALYTFDGETGFYSKWDKNEDFKNITGWGGNYFVAADKKNKTTKLYTISSASVEVVPDKPVPEGTKPEVILAGTPANLNLWGLNAEGTDFDPKAPPFDPASITNFGGNYFQTKSGHTLVVLKGGTVSPAVVYNYSADGKTLVKSTEKVGPIKHKGGNYFIDSKNFLYTVSEEGLVLVPNLPANLKVLDLKSFGATYMIDKEGRLFTVDKLGNVNERIPEGNHDLRTTKIISN